MKKWPEDETQTVPFNDIAGPLRQAVDKAYKLVEKPAARKGFGRNFKGMDVGKFCKATCPPPDDAFSRSSLEYNSERGRDAMDVILGEAIRAGMEQGRRQQLSEEKFYPRALWVRAAERAIAEGKVTEEELLQKIMGLVDGK